MKCQKCGFVFNNLTESCFHDPDDAVCLGRQLAAANERAGRLEAQMVELREAWADYAPDALDGRLISLHGVTAHRSWPKLTRILGGA